MLALHGIRWYTVLYYEAILPDISYMLLIRPAFFPSKRASYQPAMRSRGMKKKKQQQLEGEKEALRLGEGESR